MFSYRSEYMGPLDGSVSPVGTAGTAAVAFGPATSQRSRSSSSSSSSPERRLSPERRGRNNNSPESSAGFSGIMRPPGFTDRFQYVSNNLDLLAQASRYSPEEEKTVGQHNSFLLSSYSSGTESDSSDEEASPLFMDVPETILKSLPDEVRPIEVTKKVKQELVSPVFETPLVSSPLFQDHLAPNNSLAQAVSAAGVKIENAVHLLAASPDLKMAALDQQASMQHVMLQILAELRQIRLQMEKQTELLAKPVTLSRA